MTGSNLSRTLLIISSLQVLAFILDLEVGNMDWEPSLINMDPWSNTLCRTSFCIGIVLNVNLPATATLRLHSVTVVNAALFLCFNFFKFKSARCRILAINAMQI